MASRPERWRGPSPGAASDRFAAVSRHPRGRLCYYGITAAAVGRCQVDAQLPERRADEQARRRCEGEHLHLAVFTAVKYHIGMRTTREAPSGGRLGDAAEDFLKAVHALRRGDRPVSTSELAARLKLSDAAITKMARRLDAMGLVQHTPYRGVTLTAAGERIALEVLRHHRLIELFLAEFLGYDWAGVHAEAERLEHAVSPDFVERVDRALGHPEVDPHGDPIPTDAGEVPEPALERLSDLAVGRVGTVRRVLAQEEPVLRYLAEIGLVPGAALEVQDVAPLAGPITVRLGRAARPLDRRLAEAILVSPEAPGSDAEAGAR